MYVPPVVCISNKRYSVAMYFHAFTCAGVLPSQYIHFTANANLGPGTSGRVSVLYVASGQSKCVVLVVYGKDGYLAVVDQCAKSSM